jgi:two-component system, NtrC family, response regulator AtoC
MSAQSDPNASTQALAPRRAGPRLVAFWDGGSEVLDIAGSSTSVLIGRSEECDLQLNHASVSRRHARIHLGPSLAVEDLGSANGTLAGPLKLAAGERARLEPGSTVQVGDVLIVLEPGPASFDAPRTPNEAQPQFDMAHVRRLIELVARSDISVLLLGETGVGKEVAADALHRHSPRASGPLLKINCAALTDALLESELFGYERGAFTGATRDKVGLLENAKGGTVFLDEVAELPLPIQAKLLRALENREIQRIGGSSPRTIDVRFVAATNQDLGALIRKRAFREDLYYRVAGMTIRIPPLRQRRDEVLPLAELFVARASLALSHDPPELDPETRSALLAHSWPGNLRELKNTMDRAVALTTGGAIRPESLQFDRTLLAQPAPASPAEDPRPAPAEADASLPTEIALLERRRIEEVLAECLGNQTRAAQKLGISRRTLINRIEAYGIPRPRKPQR